MGWLWRRLDAKQVGSSGATSRGSPELKPTGKRWGAAPRYFPALKTGGNFEAQQAPWWPSGTPQAGPPQKKFWLRLRAARCWRAAGSMSPAARAVPAGGFAPQIPRGLHRWGQQKTHALIFWQASKCRASKSCLRKSTAQFLAALASGFLCSEAPCDWFRGLRRLDLPPAALVFRLRLRWL